MNDVLAEILECFRPNILQSEVTRQINFVRSIIH